MPSNPSDDLNTRLAELRRRVDASQAAGDAQVAQPRFMWRVRSGVIAPTSECHIIERSPVSFELRVDQFPPHRTLTSTLFRTIEAAVTAAAAIGKALRADGCTDVNDVIREEQLSGHLRAVGEISSG